MKRVIDRSVLLGSLLAASVLAGCATDDGAANKPEDTDPDPALAGADPAQVMEAPAEPSTTERAAAALPAPSIAYSGSSTVTPLVSAAAGGGIQLNGDRTDGAFAIAMYQVPVSGSTATAQFTVAASAGASFIFDMTGSGSGYSTRRLRLSRVPGSSQLQAGSATGDVMCGPLGDTATPVTLVYDGARKTFDVRINGAATACTGLATRMKSPAVGFEVMDAANAGYGGAVTFTAMSLQ